MTATDPVEHGPDRDEVTLRVENLVVEYLVAGQRSFGLRRIRLRAPGTVHAVSDVSFDVRRGETLGLVGESGCGKSTAGRAIMMLTRPTSGRVWFEGRDLTTLRERELRPLRRRIQMIFQDPLSSLNPRRTVRAILAEGLRAGEKPGPWRDRIDHALDAVGLNPTVVGEYRPAQLSGGQSQRVAIARALMVDPHLLICDEPVSALDVSIQAQILNLLEDMKERYGLTMVFIAHDLAVVKNISDRVAVMYLGKLCEVASADNLYRSAQHPYTQALVNSIPTPDPAAPLQPVRIAGSLPSPMAPPEGCRFHTRCPLAEERCRVDEPRLRRVGPGHFVACHLVPGDDA